MLGKVWRISIKPIGFEVPRVLRAVLYNGLRLAQSSTFIFLDSKVYSVYDIIVVAFEFSFTGLKT